MDRYLCFHGHFYQPPREDPWLDTILPEGSAAPSLDWNARIARESYAPLAFAHRLDGGGRVHDVINCYEWMSFNFGPTLMRWMERHDPATYARIIEADRRSVERLGHGNAMAQICHHVIMPLATPLDRELEVAWGIQDFERRFGRRPEGMWLSEAAADIPTLEVLAASGIRFTLLAPRQVRAVAPLDRDDWREVAEHEVDVSRPYRVDLPSGRSIAIFFYDGPISQAIAFEGLLGDGERFWQRMSGHAVPGIRAVGTDGETYGHHFRFGEMALAYVLDQARAGREGWRLTNFAAFLAEHPPLMRARLHEPSSWSCVHGVERWRSDCGCSTGDHPGWNQQWRGPLRAALDVVRAAADAHFFTRGRECLTDPSAALRDYGRVFCGAVQPAEFEGLHFRPGIAQDRRDLGWKLLAMQRMAVASYASCAWFFDEISRLEPLAAMAMALRAAELARATGAPDVEPKVLAELAKARSNMPHLGTGADLWRTDVSLRRETPARLAAQGLLRLQAEGSLPEPGGEAEVAWPGLALRFTVDEEAGGEDAPRTGTMTIAWRLRSDRPAYRWSLTAGGLGDPLACRVHTTPLNAGAALATDAGVCTPRADLPWNKQQALACAWAEGAERGVWQGTVLSAISGAHLFLPWVEAQSDQPLAERWVALLPALCWVFCQGLTEDDPGQADLVRFLSARTSGHSGMQALETRLSREMARLIGEENDPAEAGEMLARARAIGLSPQLWPVQNALWALRGRLAPELAGPVGELFGFAPGAL